MRIALAALALAAAPITAQVAPQAEDSEGTSRSDPAVRTAVNAQTAAARARAGALPVPAWYAMAGGLQTILVNTLAGDNDGTCGPDPADATADCSLLEALDLANADPGADLIQFSVSGTITPGDTPTVLTPVTLDGTTAPGGTRSVAIHREVPQQGFRDGLQIVGVAAAGSVVRGLTFTRTLLGPIGNSRGVLVDGAPGVVVGGSTAEDGNALVGNDYSVDIEGADASGAAVLGNDITGNDAGEYDYAIAIDGAPDATVGGAGENEANTISNTEFGIFIADVGSTNFSVVGNRVSGATEDGIRIVGGASGGSVRSNEVTGAFEAVVLEGVSDIVIGGMGAGEGNAISGGATGVRIGSGATDNQIVGNQISDPFDWGIRIQGSGSSGNEILGNVISGSGFIGVAVDGGPNTVVGGAGPGEGNVITDSDFTGVRLAFNSSSGSVVVGNEITGASDYGVWVDGVLESVIGGTGPGEGNVISGAGIGVVIWDTDPSKNAILGNAITSTGQLGIDLSLTSTGDGVTPNDGAPDADDGPNGFQNFPVITDVEPGVDVAFTLASTPNTTFRVELFASAQPGPSGFGPGERFLGAVEVTTDADGNASDTIPAAALAEGEWATATATPLDPASATGFGGTSEFSEAAQSGDPPGSCDYVVTGMGDSGAGTLRQAITDANASGGAETICFAISGTGPHVIQPTSPLPTITDPVTIDGLTQDGANCEAGPVDLAVVLDGALAGDVTAGLFVQDTDGSTVRGLELRNFRNDTFEGGDGLRFTNSDGNVVECIDSHDNVGSGVRLEDAASNRIGGTTASARNRLSGNTFYGVAILGADADDNEVAGNYIGTDATGLVADGNGFDGVVIENAAGTTIGGAADGARNVIGGNGGSGVSRLAFGPTVTATEILNNHIGVGADGTTPVPNDRHGVLLIAGSFDVVAENVIAGNDQDGVRIEGVASARTASRTGSPGGPEDDLAGRSSGGGTGHHTLHGNVIGLDAAAQTPVPNGSNGILINESPRNDVRGNTIAGNGANGLLIEGSGAADNAVGANLIGTNAAGDDLGNGGHGVLARNSGPQTIGGTYGPGECEGNTIAYNGEAGVAIVATVNASVDKGIRCNRIFLNGGLGIDLRDDGPTANDPGDGDGAGEPNRLQNSPGLASARESGGTLTVTYAVDSDPALETDGASAYPLSVEFFLADADPDHPEGRLYLGRGTYSADDHGGCGSPPCDTSAPVVLPEGVTVEAGDRVVATATDADANTSEFSAPVTVEAGEDLPTVALAVSPGTITEAGGTASLTVTLSEPTGQDVTVTLAFSGSATRGTDYTAPDEVVVEAGETEASVDLVALDDAADEGTETVVVDVASVAGATEDGDQGGALTITDDDGDEPDEAGVEFAAVQEAVLEGAGEHVVRLVVHDVTYDPPASVTVRLVAGDPADLGGFTEVTVDLTEGGLARVPVPITDDVAREGDERFIFALVDPVGTTVGDRDQFALVVVDDDEESVVVTVPPADADGDGVEDGGLRLFAVPVSGVTVADVLGTSGADVAYVVDPGTGALVPADPDAVLTAGTPVLVDVEAEADLTFEGIPPGSPTSAPLVVVTADSGEERVLAFTGNAVPLPVRLADVAVTGGSLADVALVFDSVSGAFRPVSLGALPDDASVLAGSAVIVLQVVPDGEADAVAVTVDPAAADASLPAAPSVEGAGVEGGPGEAVIAVSLAPAAEAAARRPAPRRPADAPGDRLAVRIHASALPVLDVLDGVDVESPVGGTLAALGDGLPLAALSVPPDALDAAGLVVPLVAAVPEAGTYTLSFDAPAAVDGEALTVELLDGGVAVEAEPGYTFTATAAGDLGDRFALRIALGGPTRGEQGPALDAVSAVWPNPSTGRSAVDVRVATGQRVRVAVYDALGREVLVAHNGTVGGGASVQVGLDGASLAPGVYVVVVEGETLRESRRMTVSR